jgi:hypothetical protein
MNHLCVYARQATAHVDYGTDAILQQTLATHPAFRGSTLLVAFMQQPLIAQTPVT